MGFGRNCRLTRHAEFNRVLRHRTVRLSIDPFVAFAAPGQTGEPRLGMIVGKRQLPRAVDRNRIKRLIRDSFRKARARLPGFDIVVQLVRPISDQDVKTVLDGIWDGLARVEAPAT